MKSIHWRGGAKGRVCCGRLLVFVFVAVISVNIAHAQSVQVPVTIQTAHLATTKKPLKVLVKSNDTIATSMELGNNRFNHTLKAYRYTFVHLRPGTYDFVVCDGLDYKPEVQKANVGPGPRDSINFLLRDRDKGDEKHAVYEKLAGEVRHDGRLVGAGTPVYLRHMGTGCIVDEVLTDRKSHYEFPELLKGEYYASIESDP